MRIRLNDLALVPELRQHFERSGFVTNRLSAETIEVWRPDVPKHPEPARSARSTV